MAARLKNEIQEFEKFNDDSLEVRDAMVEAREAQLQRESGEVRLRQQAMESMTWRIQDFSDQVLEARTALADYPGAMEIIVTPFGQCYHSGHPPHVIAHVCVPSCHQGMCATRAWMSVVVPSVHAHDSPVSCADSAVSQLVLLESSSGEHRV